MQTFKQILFWLKHVKKNQWTLVLCVFVYLYFYSKLNKYVFWLFLDKRNICLMIAFAWNSELHEYLSFILPFLNIYLCSLHWALWFNYRSSLYIIYTYTHTLYIYVYDSQVYIYIHIYHIHIILVSIYLDFIIIHLMIKKAK